MRCFTDEKRNNGSRMAVLLAAVMLLSVCVQAAVVPSSKQTLELKAGMEFGDVDETTGFNVEQCTEVLVVEACAL